MKKIMRLGALLLALALLCACGADTVENEETADPVSVQEGMTGLTLYDGAVTLRFVREGDDRWVWQDEPDFPLDEAALSALLALPETVTAGEEVAAEGELSSYGLENPQKYITVTVDGTDYTTWLGAQATDGRWYALLPDETVRLVPEETGTSLSVSIYSLATLPALPALTAENLRTLTVTNSEGTSFTVSCGEDGVRRTHVRDVTEATAALVEELGALTITTCLDYEPAEGALAVCALDTPAAALEVGYISEVGLEAELSLRVGGETGDGGRFVTLNGESTIYRMEESGLAALLALAESGL